MYQLASNQQGHQYQHRPKISQIVRENPRVFCWTYGRLHK
ncbi:hypothetical protein PSTT_10808 [Puccinia striiformis]|uniref:Uncharacterized protein n=1 Tax=Puccinia striiformis TaxID=27350 RepID=A0A2S4V2Y4_9BASI|nr:hypothetical protein PSTT_10808 [Puccinia striiformis]